MGSATAGLLFVIVVVIIAIVCFRYWLCREVGFRAGFGGCSCLPQSFPPYLWAELWQLQPESKGLGLPHVSTAARVLVRGLCISASPAPAGALPRLLPSSLSTTRPSSPIAPRVEGWLCTQAAGGEALWHRLAVLGFGIWQGMSLPHQERDGY